MGGKTGRELVCGNLGIQVSKQLRETLSHRDVLPPNYVILNVLIDIFLKVQRKKVEFILVMYST